MSSTEFQHELAQQAAQSLAQAKFDASKYSKYICGPFPRRRAFLATAGNLQKSTSCLVSTSMGSQHTAVEASQAAESYSLHSNAEMVALSEVHLHTRRYFSCLVTVHVLLPKPHLKIRDAKVPGGDAYL